MRTLSTASLLAVFACITSTLCAQVNEKTYLKSHLIDFRKSDDLISQETIDEHQILFVGETHGFKANYEIAQKLMSEYKRKTDFRYILAEMDWGSTQQLNELIHKKDTAGIRAFMHLTKGSPAWCKERFAYYQFIIKLNDEYQNNIQFIGLDIPSGGIESTVEELFQIMSSYNDIDSAILALQSDPRITEKNMDHVRAMINMSSTKLYQPTDLFEYQYHLQNIVNYHKAYYTNSESAWDRVRDSCMYQNFVKLEQHLSLQNEKLFGVWGHIHTYQSVSENTEWFASSLVHKSQKKVFSYRIFYFNSKCMLPSSWLPGFLKFHKPNNRLYYPMKLQNDDKFITGKKEKVKSLKKVTQKHTISIISLTDETSPFAENPYLLINGGDDWNTTQYFQSAIIVRNSPACEPLGKNQEE